MRKQDAIDRIAAAAKDREVGWDVHRVFRANLEHLPAPLISAFVAKHVAPQDPIDLVNSLRRVNASTAPAVLAGLRKKRTPTLVFLETVLAAGWQLSEGIAALTALSPPNLFGNPAEKRALLALTKKSPAVEGAQAALVASKTPDSAFLALCIAEGGEASADALVPWVQRASAGKAAEVLDLLELFTPLAPRNSKVHQLLSVSTAAHDMRTAKSPVTALFDAHGWQGPYVGVHVDALGLSGPEEATSASLSLNAADAEWSKIYIEKGRKRSVLRNLAFEENELALPKLTALETFPAWLEGVRKKLRVRWNWPALRHTSAMKGTMRTTFNAWLQG
jgi:hypothetical protein